MISRLARSAATLARVGAAGFSLAVGAFLVVRAQQGAPLVSADTSEPLPTPVAHDTQPASTESTPQAPPELSPSALEETTDWLPSSKSMVFKGTGIRPALVFPPGFVDARAAGAASTLAGESADTAPPGTSSRTPLTQDADPCATPPVLQIKRPPRYLYSSKSSTTFAPPPAQSGDGGWKLEW